MRLIIAGSRDVTDVALIFGELDRLTNEVRHEIVEVVSGGARGPDTIGAMWAKGRDIPVKFMDADWDKYGRSAGYKRNAQMAAYATHLVAFWDGESRGTKHMIDLARQTDMPVRIIRTDQRDYEPCLYCDGAYDWCEKHNPMPGGE